MRQVNLGDKEEMLLKIARPRLNSLEEDEQGSSATPIKSDMSDRLMGIKLLGNMIGSHSVDILAAFLLVRCYVTKE